MHTVLIHETGGPEVLPFEAVRYPEPGAEQVFSRRTRGA
jgi:hypothetical protein